MQRWLLDCNQERPKETEQMHAKQWGCNRSAAKEEEDKKTTTKVSKRERADAEEGARQEDLPTYLPVYRPTKPPDLLTESDQQTVLFLGVSFVMWPKVAILSMRRFSQIWL